MEKAPLIIHSSQKQNYVFFIHRAKDAESALQVMEFLKDYVRAAPGRRVILTIHQPSSFVWTLIDHVLLLSKGQLMFQGPRNKIELFFTAAGYPTLSGWNPADHYVTAVNDEFRDHELSVDEWAVKYLDWATTVALDADKDERGLGKKERASSILRLQSMDMVETQRSSSIAVVFELTYRYFLNLWFNPGILGK